MLNTANYTEVRSESEEFRIILNVTFSKRESIEFGLEAFLSLSVFKAALNPVLVTSLSDGASNAIPSSLLSGYAVVQNVCDVKC